jgi:hypothetical protein
MPPFLGSSLHAASELSGALALVVLGLASPAWAQMPQAATEQAPPESTGDIPSVEPSALDPVARHRKEDASVDRGFFNSHAETLRAGDVAVNSYELLLLGVSGGLTDNVQLSLTTLLPVVSDMPIVLLFQGKYAFYRDEMTTVAVRGNLSYLASEPDEDEGDASVTLFGGAVAVDRFLDDAGRFAVHGALQFQGAMGSFEGDVDVADGVIIGLETGLTGRVSKRFKILVDVLLPASYSDGDFELADAALFSYGVRFHGEDLAADLGFIRPLGDVDTGKLVLGVPWVAFTARF